MPKGETRGARKARAHVVEVDAKTSTHDLVFRRDAHCRSCLGTRRCWLPDQMHEITSRAATRGMLPAVRFNTRNCIRLCAYCHGEITGDIGGKRLDLIVTDDTLGADGIIQFIRVLGGLHEKDRKAG